MNLVYPSVVAAFLNGEIDIDAVALVAELLDGYTVDPTDEFLTDITGRFGDPVLVTVTGVSDTDGSVSIDPVVFPSVATGNTITGVIFYVDTGTEATSPLVCCIDRRADTVPLGIDTNDGDVTFTWPRLFKL